MKITSNFALLDVKRGRAGLETSLRSGTKTRVTITGWMDNDPRSFGNDDGTSKEFSVLVDGVELKSETDTGE